MMQKAGVIPVPADATNTRKPLVESPFRPKATAAPPRRVEITQGKDVPEFEKQQARKNAEQYWASVQEQEQTERALHNLDEFMYLYSPSTYANKASKAMGLGEMSEIDKLAVDAAGPGLLKTATKKAAPTLIKRASAEFSIPKITGNAVSDARQQVIEKATAKLNELGYYPSEDNLKNSYKLMQKRTPNPAYPYEKVQLIQGNHAEAPKSIMKSWSSIPGSNTPGIVALPTEPYERSVNAAQYYAILAHEMEHATGTPSKETFEKIMSQLFKEGNNGQAFPDYLGVGKLDDKAYFDSAEKYLLNGVNALNKKYAAAHPGKQLGLDPELVKYLVGLNRGNDGYVINNATEIAARLGQVLNHLGIDSKDGLKNFTGEVLKHGLAAHPINNNILPLRKLINETNSNDFFAKLVRDREIAKALIPITAGGTLATQVNQQ